MNPKALPQSLIDTLDRFSARFPARLDALWTDVRTLAVQVLASSDHERNSAWHHLVMAVGNFKRQSPIHAFAGLTKSSSPLPTNRRITLPNGNALDSDDADTWPNVEGSGIRRATATAILAALWPDQHATMDWHARTAAVALVGATRGWRRTTPIGDADSRERVPSDWITYGWYRGELQAWLDIDTETVRPALTPLERGLFEVNRSFWDEHPEAHSVTWKEYGAQLLQFAHGI